MNYRQALKKTKKQRFVPLTPYIFKEEGEYLFKLGQVDAANKIMCAMTRGRPGPSTKEELGRIISVVKRVKKFREEIEGENDEN